MFSYKRLLTAALFLAANSAAAKVAPCEDLLPAPLAEPAITKSLSPEALVSLREIGVPYEDGRRSDILAVSPNQHQMAFQLWRADLATNSYCLGMVVVDLQKANKAILVAEGGDLIRLRNSPRGLAGVKTGNPMKIAPRWSPDGKWIAFLRREAGATDENVQLWRARSDGSEAIAVTKVPFDIEDFRWTAQGQGIIFSGRPATKAALNLIEDEGRSGFLYDDRFAPLASNRPFPHPSDVEYFLVDIQTGVVRKPHTEEVAAGGFPSTDPLTAKALNTRNRSGDVASVKPLSDALTAQTILSVVRNSGKIYECSLEVCNGVVDLAWSNAEQLIYIRREGWAKGQLGVYQWSPGFGAPRKILVTNDLLVGCQVTFDDNLVCAREGSVQPRRLVRIDLANGSESVVFDPNPEAATWSLGLVKRLVWKNAYGIEAFGDLVLPPDHKEGQLHPLVVVQYNSRGFLRGGTGNEYPIPLFANRGFAVLSVNRPELFGLSKGAKTYAEADRIGRVDWADRRSVLSSTEAGVSLAIKSGAVDAAKLGITGLSDGATSTQFALINSSLFSAAAISSCCEDLTSVMTALGPSFARFYHELGYPLITEKTAQFWGPYSFVLNAQKMNTPLLIQMPDDEYIYALESVAALTEAKRPVEMYVFPDEHHIKWQPVHRLAIYKRNIDWFEFWLKNYEDTDPLKAEQYKRWRNLRVARDANKSEADLGK